MLDDQNLLSEKDPFGALEVALNQYKQAELVSEVINPNSDATINKVVVTGMGGSALAALLIKSWQESKLNITFEIVRDYKLPNYVDDKTLVIASSYSGNTEETLSCLDEALKKGANIGCVSSGGKLVEIAKNNELPYVVLPSGIQPRMGVIANLRAILAVLVSYGVVSQSDFDEVKNLGPWLNIESKKWGRDVSTSENQAKQLALLSAGKTAIFYSSTAMGGVAYKWKISWNENAKNVAFWNVLPEFNHNEFMGWTSHPVEKPYVVFDLRSSFDHPKITKRFEISDRLLSGKGPKANVIELQGESVIAQMLWASIFADFVSIYLAILNGVDPSKVELIEKLKQELA
ncbi:bifunctional phosphoglucose/phosphomannose isomerase [TM7 phylum sp. oral taxon 350]|nr:bifunctional phosphoglucose/phosphomannose isomerase [TM7 phylum sp. oral taxon 350]